MLFRSGDVDFAALNRIAIAHSDAVMISSENIDPALIEYARQLGKPLFSAVDGNDYSQCPDFYAGLIG